MPYIAYDSLSAADARSREMWAAILGRDKHPQDVTEYLYSRRQRTGDAEADAGLPDGVDAAIVVAERDEHLDTLVLADVMEPQEAGECAELYPAWALGSTYAVGDLVQYESALYRCRQAHTAAASNWTPPDVPALWLVYRKDADGLLAWVAGEQVYVGTQRTYSGKTYEALQAHVTQEDWTPDTTPALWREIVEAPTTNEWAAGVAYSIGDQVTYQGKLYQCLQAHTSIATWNPAVAASLWKAL
jgi:hypothetical protein